MACEKVEGAPGVEGLFICKRGRGRPRRPCVVCTKKPNQVLCDGKGCNKPMCRDCAHHVDPDLDYCPDCWKVEESRPKQETLF